MTEQYKCPSFYIDDKLIDCLCGKCESLNNKNMQLNQQQIEFLLDELKDVREGNNYSQYAKTIAQQLYDKLIKLHDLQQTT